MELVKSDRLQTIEDRLAALGIRYRNGVDLSGYSCMRTGGIADLIVYPKNVGEVSAALRLFKDAKLAYKVIGSTSNLLFLDDARYSILLSIVDMNGLHYDEQSNTLVADGGAMLPDLAREALFHSMAGFEGLEGIPGTIGGGIFMNAGAYGCEIKDTLVSVEIAHEDGSVRTYTAAEMKLGHRTSILRKEALGGVICKCVFSGEKGDPQAIFNKMEIFHAKRHKYQDFMYPNLGSIFSGSPYRALGRRDKTFKYISAVYYLFCYEFKIFRRESPINRKWLNDIVVKRFNLDFDPQPFSDKTLNCLVNRGQGTDEMVRFITEMERLTQGRIPLENEVVHGF